MSPDVSATQSKGRIAEILRERIVSGVLPMGSSLSDKAIAAETGVSRTPVREALLELAADGLVVFRPRSGTFVFGLSDGELRDICELRGIYEAGAIRAACERDRNGLVAGLQEIVARAAFALEEGDLDQCQRLDTEFHARLVEKSGNMVLLDAYRRIAGKVSALRATLPETRTRIGAALAQNRRIVDLIAAARIGDAEHEIRDHMFNVYALLQDGRRTGD